MRHFFSRCIATILLAAFSVYLIPNEFVHALYGHDDTHEVSCSKERTIGTQHIHCYFLSFEASLFTVSSLAICPASYERAFAFMSTEEVHEGITFTFYSSLRGPPALA